MKKIIAITICIFISVSIIYSQAIYIKPSIGYGFEINKGTITTSSINYYEDDDSYSYSLSYKTHEFSFGKGTKYGISTGIELNNIFDFGLDLNYSKTKSPELTSYSVYTYEFEYNDPQTARATEYYNFDCKSFFITPELIFNPEFNKSSKFKPLLKIGPVIGFSLIEQNYELMYLSSVQGFYPFESIKQKMKYDWTSSIGFATSLGLEYEFDNDITLFIEFEYFDISITPKSSEIIESSYNSQDNLEDLYINEVYFEYSDSYNDYENSDPNQPSKFLPTKYSHSSINMFVGLKFYIY